LTLDLNIGILCLIFGQILGKFVGEKLSDEKRYWIGFSFVKGIGAVRFQALLDAFGSAEAAWKAPADALYQVGLGSKVSEHFLQIRSQISVDRIWEKIVAADVKVLTWEDDEYPRRLKEIAQPPPVLYLRGSLKPEDDWAVGIVGTRRMTAYGRIITEDTAHLLAVNGITVVSGLARGVDAVAHSGAIKAGGRTIAVLGSGVDRIYPPEHRKLADQILECGVLISDYPPGTPPEASNFPPRNRLISGLSLAVLIVEAGVRSGALITAQFAAEQGRDVFAVPGNINAPHSAGPNRLIRDGAIPLLDPRDLLETLDLEHVPEHQAARSILPPEPKEARLLEILGQEPKHVDELTNLAGLPIEEVSATLTMMELKGMVRQVGGMNYVAVRELPQGYDP
jgi:DNA processing protein